MFFMSFKYPEHVKMAQWLSQPIIKDIRVRGAMFNDSSFNLLWSQYAKLPILANSIRPIYAGNKLGIWFSLWRGQAIMNKWTNSININVKND